MQFILSFILFIIFVYIFAILGFLIIPDDYQDGRCDKLWYCFLYTFDWTFISNGGVGGYLTNLSPTAEYDYFRFFFDNISNILLVIIMINIWSGIIIDTFGNLRDVENERNRDIEDKCFICGNLKTTFDKL